MLGQSVLLTWHFILSDRALLVSLQGMDRALHYGNLTEALLVRALRPNKLVMLTGGQRLDARGDPEDFGFSDIEDSETGDFDSFLVEDALNMSVSSFMTFYFVATSVVIYILIIISGGRFGHRWVCYYWTE